MEITKALIAVEGTTYYSQPVETGGLTGVRLELRVIAASAGASSVTAEVEQSDDLDNWFPLGGIPFGATVSAFPGVDSKATSDASSSVTGKYLRIAYVVSGTGGGRATIAATVTLFQFGG